MSDTASVEGTDTLPGAVLVPLVGPVASLSIVGVVVLWSNGRS